MSFHNGGQFPVSDESLGHVLSNYGIEGFSYRIATRGIENTTCIIEASKQKYALRIYRQAKKSLSAIEHELAFMDMLRKDDLPIPRKYVNQARQSITHCMVDGRQWHALLMEYMPGKHPGHYTQDLLGQMAQVQARIHLTGENIDYDGSTSRLTHLVENEFMRHIDKNSITDKQLSAYTERIAQYEIALDPDLPCGYSHFDFDLGNILVDHPNRLSAILDFDDLQYAPLVVCLGYTLWNVLYETGNEDLVDQYVAEYQKTRPLNALEQNYLPKVMLFRHYVITALKILNGRIAKDDIQRYEDLESRLIRLTSVL